MAPVYWFCLIVFAHQALILSVGYANGYQDNCPRSFSCGKLGVFHYPFTKAEHPDCGLLPIHDCDNIDVSPKLIQLEKSGRTYVLTGLVQQNKITIFDQDYHKRLQSNICDALIDNVSLPSPSPLVSISVAYNVTLFRCHHSINVKPPPDYITSRCPEYDIYFESRPSPNKELAHMAFSTCSVVQLPAKDFADNQDLQSFLSAQMVIEVLLSYDCDECYNHKGGQCRHDRNNNFFCDNEDRVKVSKLRLGLGIGFGIALLGILIIGICLFGRRYKRTHAPSDLQYQSRNKPTDLNDRYSNLDLESGKLYFEIPLFSYKELEEATNNFRHNSQLGNGGFGTVYHGKLRDGREVAVKRLYEHNYRRVEQFTNEIVILTCMRHRNLVSLYGCTSRHSRELLLVYEYIPNGTVACHLHGDSARPGLLPWHIRMKIAIETASALAYLHASDIIHRDVKTNNILLDNN